MILALLACVAAPDPPWPPATLDTGSPEWTDAFDVVVVGSGPSGIAAALEARSEGAEVLLLERDDTAGLGILLASDGFAVGTPWETDSGIADSVTLAAVDWPQITGSPADFGGVRQFLGGSAATLNWLTGFGMQVSALRSDLDGGSVSRIHTTSWPAWDKSSPHPLIQAFDGEIRTSVEVTEPVLDRGRVIGVRWVDLVTGAEGTTRAGAVVVATGGFLRDLDRVEEKLPGITARDPVFETNPQSDGGGLPFLTAVGAGWEPDGDLGVFLHSIHDPWGADGEALMALGTSNGLLVGEDGARFADENLQRSFDLYDRLPPGDVFNVFDGDIADFTSFYRPFYNWSDPLTAETFTLDQVAADSPDIYAAESLPALAEAARIDAAGLQAAVDEWNLDLVAGLPDPYGRQALMTDTTLDGDRWFAVRISPGLAKSFLGVATDTEGHVLTPAGDPIPGLYAAGEVAGMILGGGAGDGFAGSMSACYQGGRIAGGNAAVGL